jgi:hypothetical protein
MNETYYHGINDHRFEPDVVGVHHHTAQRIPHLHACLASGDGAKWARSFNSGTGEILPKVNLTEKVLM